MTTLYMRKPDPQQPLWPSVAGSAAEGYPALDELARGADQVLIGPEEARRTLAFLKEKRIGDDGDGPTRTPVEVVDLNGECVDL